MKRPTKHLVATEKRILTSSGRLQQVGALVHRRNKVDTLQILLITSRGSGRWIIPKGWPQIGRTLAETAACEAYEEAGIRGTIHSEPIGSFHYSKMDLPPERLNQFTVAVFALRFTVQEKNWPEREERVCEWMHPQEAANRVEEPDLKILIRQFGDSQMTSAAE